VRDDGGPSCPPDSVTISYSDEVIATIRDFTNDPPRWQFVFDSGSDITASDVLQERFKVVAVNNLGQQLALMPEGRMQMDYIRGTRASETDVELTIDFSQEGNARKYLQHGWGSTELKCTRTEGKASFMEIPVKESQVNYRIEMHLRPFVIPGKLLSQDLDVYVNDSLVSRSSLRGAESIVTYEVPQYLHAGHSIKLRFDLSRCFQALGP
jgi:hypothetical protein